MKYRVGDLIVAAARGEVGIIAHGANCFNVMKAGIAPKIANAFPKLWEADQETAKGDEGKLGSFSSAILSKDLIGYNLYSQYGWWRRKDGEINLDYEALRNSLIAVRKDLEIREWVNLSIGLPKIGSGLAGGDWGQISEIIDYELACCGFDVTIYVLSEDEIPEGAYYQVSPTKIIVKV